MTLSARAGFVEAVDAWRVTPTGRTEPACTASALRPENPQTTASGMDSMMTRPGILVTIDGPGGVGKSVTVTATADYLNSVAVAPYVTRQPSSGVLGDYIRKTTDTYRGMALANLVAAERHYQQDTEIEPRLAEGRVVLCDRGLPSSLVLQGIDGVSTDTVWALNSGIRIPDASVFLRADPKVITDRMRQRGGPHGRFEQIPDYAALETALFDSVAEDLTRRGWAVHTIECTELEPRETAIMVANLIVPLLGDEHAYTASDRSPA